MADGVDGQRYRAAGAGYPQLDHEVPLLPSKHPEDLEIEDDPADLPLSSRRQPPTSSRQGCKLAE